eukprot:304834-Rhodomonas_salina.1
MSVPHTAQQGYAAARHRLCQYQTLRAWYGPTLCQYRTSQAARRGGVGGCYCIRPLLHPQTATMIPIAPSSAAW